MHLCCGGNLLPRRRCRPSCIQHDISRLTHVAGAMYAMGDRGGCKHMVDMHSIGEMTARIVQEFQPERIILFGSYAHGTPTADSDVDLLVILPFEGKAPRKSLEILNKINPQFAVDLLVRTPQQVQQRLA